MEITELQKHIIDFRDERDRAQFHNPKDLAASIAIEAAELQEKFLRKTVEESTTIGQQDPEVADELADIINYCLSFAEACNIDVAQACLKKLEHNKVKYPVIRGRVVRRSIQSIKSKFISQINIPWHIQNLIQEQSLLIQC